MEMIHLKEAISCQLGKRNIMSQLEKINRDNCGIVEVFSTKAVGAVTTGNVSTDTEGDALLDAFNTDILQSLNLRDPFIEQFATVSRTSKPVLTYTDFKPKDGNVGFVGEGGAKPQLDLQVVVKTERPRKAAGHIIHSTEVIQDVPRMELESHTLLLKKYLLKRQWGLLFGDGQNDDPVGITEIAPAYNPSIGGVQNSSADNLYDAIIAAATQIYSTVNYIDEGQFMPNVAFVNPIDHSNLKLIRNATNGMYMFPNISVTGNTSNLGGFPVIAKSEIPRGKLLIGDFSRLNIVNYIDYTVLMGFINDQFIRNLFTIVGEGRFYSFVKDLDKKAFVYDDISTILDGIVSGPGSGSGGGSGS